MSKRYQVSWDELKSLAAKKFVGMHSYENSNSTIVHIIEDGKPSFWTAIFKPGDTRYDGATVGNNWTVEQEAAAVAMRASRVDWEANHAATANGPTKPRDYDGRDKTQPVSLSSKQWHYWHSRADTATELKAGEQFMLSHSASGAAVKVWRYRDPVWMAGGNLKYQGAEMGDHVTFGVYAPATELTPNEGGTGNANLIPFLGLIIPAAGNGAYDVDLENAHPIPAPSEDGFWSYELPSDMRGPGTVTPGGSKYHLFATRVDLTRFVTEELLLGEGATSYSPQNINASLCLPEWRFECTLHNVDGEHALNVVWRVLVSRYWTTL